MIPGVRKKLLLLGVTIFSLTITTYACTCIGRTEQVTETGLNATDLAVKGKIISVTDFIYYDTLSYSLAGLKVGPEEMKYLGLRYRVFKLVVEQRFKGEKKLSDTISIVTGHGGGDCGYEFETGKDYIVYAQQWKEKIISTRHRKRKDKRKISEVVIANKYYTNICTPTQESNQKELDNLKRLTE